MHRHGITRARLTRKSVVRSWSDHGVFSKAVDGWSMADGWSWMDGGRMHIRGRFYVICEMCLPRSAPM